MKRTLRVLDRSDDELQAGPSLVTLGQRLVSVADTGAGLESRRFVSALVAAGATVVDSTSGAKPDARIVIRVAPHSPKARLRAASLEEGADLILGSARPAFARYLASACARWVNS